MSPERFWALSLRELWNEHRAYAIRARTAQEHDVALAWYVENFRRHDRTKPLPSLATLFQQMRGGQTPQELLTALYELSARAGLPVTVTKGHDGAHAHAT